LLKDFTAGFRRLNRLFHDPLVEILIGKLQQGLKLVQLGGVEILGMEIHERPQYEVRFPEAPAPGPELQSFSSCLEIVQHEEGADIEGVAPEHQSPSPDFMRPPVLFPLYAPVATLKGVGARIAPCLRNWPGRSSAMCCS